MPEQRLPQFDESYQTAQHVLDKINGKNDPNGFYARASNGGPGIPETSSLSIALIKDIRLKRDIEVDLKPEEMDQEMLRMTYLVTIETVIRSNEICFYRSGKDQIKFFINDGIAEVGNQARIEVAKCSFVVQEGEVVEESFQTSKRENPREITLTQAVNIAKKVLAKFAKNEDKLERNIF